MLFLCRCWLCGCDGSFGIQGDIKGRKVRGSECYSSFIVVHVMLVEFWDRVEALLDLDCVLLTDACCSFDFVFFGLFSRSEKYMLRKFSRSTGC